MNNSIPASDMIEYLQMWLTNLVEDIKAYGEDDMQVQKEIERICACKSMVETLICIPVNLQMNGIVTVGG